MSRIKLTATRHRLPSRLSVPHPSQFNSADRMAAAPAWGDGSGTELSRDAMESSRLAIGRLVGCLPTPDKKRAPRPCCNCSRNALAGIRTAWDGSGPWRDRGRCDDRSRNYPQTTAWRICPDRDLERVLQPRRAHKRRRARTESNAVLAATTAVLAAT